MIGFPIQPHGFNSAAYPRAVKACTLFIVSAATLFWHPYPRTDLSVPSLAKAKGGTILRSSSFYWRYTRERISYWLCRPAALELRRSQDGRNAVCLRRAEG